MCAMTHPYVCHGSFVCVPWFIHPCAMHELLTRVPWLTHVCAMTHWGGITSAALQVSTSLCRTSCVQSPDYSMRAMSHSHVCVRIHSGGGMSATVLCSLVLTCVDHRSADLQIISYVFHDSLTCVQWLSQEEARVRLCKLVLACVERRSADLQIISKVDIL